MRRNPKLLANREVAAEFCASTSSPHSSRFIRPTAHLVVVFGRRLTARMPRAALLCARPGAVGGCRG
jgi:hypothetical protein